jgi:hypothetical protein
VAIYSHIDVRCCDDVPDCEFLGCGLVQFKESVQHVIRLGRAGLPVFHELQRKLLFVSPDSSNLNHYASLLTLNRGFSLRAPVIIFLSPAQVRSTVVI